MSSLPCVPTPKHGPTISPKPNAPPPATTSPDELWLVDVGDPFPAHHRPALVVGPPDTFGADFPFAIVCPLTTTRRGLSIHVEVDADPTTGLATTSYVQCEMIRSINRRRLVHHLGAIDLPTHHHVEQILRTLVNH